MRTVGKGKIPKISTEPSGENLTRFFELVEGTRGLGFAGITGMKLGFIDSNPMKRLTSIELRLQSL